jgi:hypothetical protein
VSNPNFSTILSTTLNNYRKTLTDNIFMDRPLAWHLVESKKRVRMEDGGVKIIEPLRYAAGQATSYTGWDQIAITPQTGLTAAEYDWKQIVATVAISKLEQLQNSGDQQVINLVKAKVEQAEDTLKDLVNTMLWADGTGNSGKHWAGILSYITTANSSVGGIDGATQAYWRNTIVDPGTAVPITLAHLFQAINTAANGNDKVDAMFTSLAIYGKVEALFQPQVQYMDVKAANAGFDNLTVKGVPLFFDNAGTTPAATKVFGVNSKYLTVVGHSDDWFVNGDFTDAGQNTASAHATSGAATTVNGKYSLITATGNLVCSNRARQFVLTDIV